MAAAGRKYVYKCFRNRRLDSRFLYFPPLCTRKSSSSYITFFRLFTLQPHEDERVILLVQFVLPHSEENGNEFYQCEERGLVVVLPVLWSVGSFSICRWNDTKLPAIFSSDGWWVPRIQDTTRSRNEIINLDLMLVKMAPLQVAWIIFYNLITISGDSGKREVILYSLSGFSGDCLL